MKRIAALCLLLALAVSAPAFATTSVSVGIMLGNAPPPPRVVLVSEPRWTEMPTLGVSYYSGPCDYDYFRYGQYFYIYNSGYWYRSAGYRGPFIAIRETYVPRAFYGLNDRGYHWRHGWRNAPPGQFRRVDRRMDRREDRRDDRRDDRHDRGNDQGNGRGHGRGHGGGKGGGNGDN